MCTKDPDPEVSKLTFAEVRLNTLDDDKREESRILLRVRASDGRTVASKEGSFGRFADRTNRTIELDIINQNISLEEVKGGSACVEWLNIGSNDQWNASFEYNVRFSAGDVLVATQDKTEFQENKTTKQCPPLT
jgi:hypothetical protein